jgi:hypothetical protein
MRQECSRFDFDWEILIKLAEGLPPDRDSRALPVTVFSEGKKVRMIRDSLTWLVAWAKARFEGLH